MVGREGASGFQNLALLSGLGLPIAMLVSVGLGSAGAVGGIRKDRRAVIYGTISLALNGVLGCVELVRGSPPPLETEEEPPPATSQTDASPRLIATDSPRS